MTDGAAGRLGTETGNRPKGTIYAAITLFLIPFVETDKERQSSDRR